MTHDPSTANPSTPLRIVTFNVLPIAFGVTAQWVKQNGHQIVLLVTTPGPSTRRSPVYRQVINNAAPEIDILVTTRLRKVALPLIRELAPDLIVSFSFPYRIPPEICAIPRLGAVNLHPTVLPAYRGPNPMRVIYEGHSVIGATMHWTEEEFDTGRVLAQQSVPLPVNATPEAVMGLWGPLISGAFNEGMSRALAGDAGTLQDHSQSSYAAAFTEEEYWLSMDDTRRVIQRKSTALNILAPAAKLRLGDQAYLVARVDPLEDVSAAALGTILDQSEQGFILQVADGAVRVQATRMQPA